MHGGLEVMKHKLGRLCIDLLIQMMVQTCTKTLQGYLQGRGTLNNPI